MSRDSPVPLTTGYKICQHYCNGGRQPLGGVCNDNSQCSFNNPNDENVRALVGQDCAADVDCYGCSTEALKQIQAKVHAAPVSNFSDNTKRGIAADCDACKATCPKTTSPTLMYILAGVCGVVLLIVLIVFFAHKKNYHGVKNTLSSTSSGQPGQEEFLSALHSVGDLSDLTDASMLSMLTQ